MGATGFALFFGINRRKLWIVTVASAVSWYIYLLLCNILPHFTYAMFLTTVVIVLFSTLAAKKLQCPVTIFSTPILIQFIPGAALYYTMYALIRGNPHQSAANGKSLIGQVAAMSIGIIAAETITKLARILYRTAKQYLGIFSERAKQFADK